MMLGNKQNKRYDLFTMEELFFDDDVASIYVLKIRKNKRYHSPGGQIFDLWLPKEVCDN